MIFISKDILMIKTSHELSSFNLNHGMHWHYLFQSLISKYYWQLSEDPAVTDGT